MSRSLEYVDRLLEEPEGEHLEFKEARNTFSFNELLRYCAALANEGGGRLVLGVGNSVPRMVVGSQAFLDLQRVISDITHRLQLRVEAQEVIHADGRIVVFVVPSRSLGRPVHVDGAYYMRSGESLRTMTQDMLRSIFLETVSDYSALVCPGATLSDLDQEAIARFRSMWAHRSGNQSLMSLPETQLLSDAELVSDAGVTYAALVLLGSQRALSTHLPQAEVVFEYRSGGSAGPAQQRTEFRLGSLLILDEVWDLISLRNEEQHFQQGLFMRSIRTWNETVVREAVLNAICHRDYQLPGSVFVRQYPRRLEVDSPGGFPRGVTAENILYQQVPRNRRIAEAFAKCGLVERAGQGVDRMFEESIRESKAMPNYHRSDDHQVLLVLQGEVQDPRFLRFLEQAAQESQTAFGTEDLLVLDLVHKERPVGAQLQPVLHHLADRGIVERIGRGRGTRYMLARRFYQLVGQRGAYTRRLGLDRESSKALLLRHIQDSRRDGSPLSELCQVLPALSRHQVQGLLRELKAEGAVHPEGRTRGARWYPGHGRESIASD